jgi:hypothetical protein
MALVGACVSTAPIRQTEPRGPWQAGEFAAFDCGFAPSEADTDAELTARGSLLQLAQAPQSVMLREARMIEGGASPPRYAIRTVARIGTECPDATSESRCRDLIASAELNALSSMLKTGSLAASETYFVVGNGDSFSVLSSAHDMRSLLGPTDTPAEAWLWLMRSTGISTFSCNSAESSAHKRDPSGFELRVRRATNGCRPLTEAVITYRVAPDGMVTELSSETIVHEPEGCSVP